MPRAPLVPGTHGTVNVVGQARVDGRWATTPGGAGTPKAERYRASTRYRDRSGATHQVERFAPTKGAARAKLADAIAEFDQAAERKASRRTRVALGTIGVEWLAQVERNPELSRTTRTLYAEVYARCIEGTELAATSLTEANTVPVLRRFLQGVADERGSGTAKTVRSILSGVIGLAVDDGLAGMNACRSIRPIRAKVAKTTSRDIRRALTPTEWAHLISVADKHSRAVAQDVADLLAFMAATGVRLSEALALRWEDVQITEDATEATVHVRGTKTAASDRVLALPTWMTGRLSVRRELAGDGLVFASPGTKDRNKVRDRRNVTRIIRVVLDAAGLEWATSHSLRRTAATFILEAGRPITEAQAQLGHADAAMTLRVYAAKRSEPSKAAARALELPDPAQSVG